MKRALTAGVFLSMLVMVLLTGQPSQVKEIAPGVFVRQEDGQKRIIANCGWVVFRDYVLVIDANFPWGARAILNEVRRTTDKPVRFVFDTHYRSEEHTSELQSLRHLVCR